MRNILLPIILIMAGAQPASAQQATQPSANAILQSILLNNTTLKADADAVLASQAENRTGLTLADPEVEFSYFWGSPHAIGNRQDLSITQHFDYATVFGLKRRLAQSHNEVLALEQQLRRIRLVGEARQCLVQLTYLNQQQQQLGERMAVAQSLVEKYQKALQQGDATRLEHDKAQLALLNLQAESDELAIEQRKARGQLQAMNGGNPIAYSATDYEAIFDAENDSATSTSQATTQWLDAQGKAIKQEIKNAQAASLPELTFGYASELTAGEKFRGLTIGLSLPLWSNRAGVRSTRARQEAHRSEAEEVRFQFEQQRLALKDDMESHRKLADRLKQTIAQNTTHALLKRALDLGEISLLDYLQEASLLYDLQDKALQAERDYQQARCAWQLVK